MCLSRTVTYAVHAILLLGQSTRGGVASSELALMGHMPERFLLQISAAW